MASLNSVGLVGMIELGRFSAAADPRAPQRLGLSVRVTRCSVWSYIAWQKIWRLAGADHMHVNGIANKFSESRRQRHRIRPGMPEPRCSPASLHSPCRYSPPANRRGRRPRPIAALGSTDLIVTAGGGIMAHPGGPAAGVAAMQRSVGGGRGRRCARRLCAYPSQTAARARDGGMTTARPLPSGPLVAFYGDDFTGSLGLHGSRRLLPASKRCCFLIPPTAERLRDFLHTARAIGIAGVARVAEPAMDGRTPAAGLSNCSRATGAPVVHYKVCSTFDSAPQVGSIGRAIESHARRFSTAPWTPMIVADPGMGRYQAFGNLFALVNGIGHRLDRHPTMSRHPVTPMDEADLSATSPGRPAGDRPCRFCGDEARRGRRAPRAGDLPPAHGVVSHRCARPGDPG